MSSNLSERARIVVSESLPLMKQHHVELEEAIASYIEKTGPDVSLTDPARSASTTIMDMLLGLAADPSPGRTAEAIAETARDHARLGLNGEHYSSFGDALKPAMRDVLGTKATSPVLAAWTDAYWTIVWKLFQQERKLAA